MIRVCLSAEIAKLNFKICVYFLFIKHLHCDAPPVPPDPPVLELKKVDGNSFSLLWSARSEGDGPITGYVLEYKAANGESFTLIEPLRINLHC